MKAIVPCILFLWVAGTLPVVAQVAKEAPSNPVQLAPQGYTIRENSISPAGRYGVTVPTLTEADEENAKNSLVDLRTGRVLAVLQTKFTGWSRHNRGGILPARWSKDGSFLLWEVAGKWAPMAITLVKIEKEQVVWQLDVLQAAQGAILKVTQKAKPEAYAAAKKSNEGNGEAYPEGFTVDVKTEDKPLELPLWISVILTSNPKGIEGVDTLESYLLGTVDEKGQFVVKEFQFELPKSQHFIDSETFH